MFEPLVIFNRSVVCSVFSFISGPEKSKSTCGMIYFDRQHTLATIEDHAITPFLKSGFVFKIPGKDKTGGNKKLQMDKKKKKLGPGERRKSQELL